MAIPLTTLLTIIATGLGAVLPMVLPLIPPPYNLAASWIIAALGSIYHLYQPSPSGK